MTTDHGGPPTHEENVARLLELEQAREARRQKRRRAIPWVVVLAIVLAFGGGLWWNAAQDAQVSDQRACERFEAMSGGDPDDC